MLKDGWEAASPLATATFGLCCNKGSTQKSGHGGTTQRPPPKGLAATSMRRQSSSGFPHLLPWPLRPGAQPKASASASSAKRAQRPCRGGRLRDPPTDMLEMGRL